MRRFQLFKSFDDALNQFIILFCSNLDKKLFTKTYFDMMFKQNKQTNKKNK